MIFLFIALPLVVAGILPLVGKISRKVLPDVFANGVLLFLLVNAAVAGAFDAGATEVWVKDAHGPADNILIEKLDPRARTKPPAGLTRPPKQRRPTPLPPDTIRVTMATYCTMHGSACD